MQENKFIDRKDGSTTFTLAGTQTFEGHYDNRFMMLALNIMMDVDKKADALRRFLDRQFKFIYDREFKLWWSLFDYRHQQAQAHDGYFDDELILLLTDSATDPNTDDSWKAVASVNYSHIMPGYGIRSEMERFRRWLRILDNKRMLVADALALSPVDFPAPMPSAVAGEPVTITLTRDNHTGRK